MRRIVPGMCHDDASRPPSPPIVGEVAGSGLFDLSAADGARFAAYWADPAPGSGKNIVILPDVRGLHPYYEHLAVRFAEAGFHAVAIDYFGRTHGVAERDDDFDWQKAIPGVQPAHVQADVAAAAAHLTAKSPGPVFTVGFCFGGSQSWRLAAGPVELAGCMGFYGRPSMVADVEDGIHRPMLLLVAGADFATPLADFEDFDRRLSAAGCDHEMHVYEGAPHSFFDRSFAEWDGACQDAWRRMLAFTDAHA